MLELAHLAPITPSPGVPPCSVERSKPSCMPRQMPSTGCLREPLAQQLVEAELAQVRHTARERPHARHHEPSRTAQQLVIVGDRNAGPDMSERLLHGAAVAHAVVHHGDLHGLIEQAHEVSVPFVLGTPLSVGSSATASRRARANALNAASIM